VRKDENAKRRSSKNFRKNFNGGSKTFMTALVEGKQKEIKIKEIRIT